MNWKILLPVLMLFAFASCDQEEFYSNDVDYDALVADIESMTAEDYTADLAELDMRSEDDELIQRFRGKHKCFTFVFPVTIIFPDETTLAVETAEEFRDAMHAWKEANPEAEVRPVIEMPFDVELRDGTVVTIETQEQLDDLKNECFENRPDVPRFKLCFEPVFPISIAFPDESVVVVEDLEAFKTLMREWKQANPDAEDHPMIVFPIEIITSDGETVTVENLDELKDHLKDCAEGMKKHHKKKKKGDK